LPFIAIVSEKVVSLSIFEEKLNICIEEYANTRGRIPPLRRSIPSVYVCTIEKANILVNQLIAEDRINEIGLVIVDEASWHLLIIKFILDAHAS
jgi:POLQ-like helicase